MRYIDTVVVDALRREQKRIRAQINDTDRGLRVRANRLRSAALAAEDDLNDAHTRLEAIEAKLKELS